MYDTVQAAYTTASEMNFYFDFFVKKKKKGTSEESREKEVGFLLSRLNSPIILFALHPAQESGRFLNHQDEHRELFGCGTRKHLP